MKISIITVVYNNERTILDAIHSVSSQTYEDIEYIIIDGASTDGTLDLINSCSEKIARIVSEPDKGLYDAMNKGIAMATGDVIGILNSDDIYADNTVINLVMQLFLQDQSLDMVYGDLVYVQPNDLSKVVRAWKSLPYYNRYFEDGHVPPHPTLFLKRAIYQKAGNFNLDMRLAADYEFMLRIFKKYSFKSYYLSKLLVKMRLGGSTNKNISNIIKGNMEVLRAWKINKMQIPFFLMPRRVLNRIAQFKK